MVGFMEQEYTTRMQLMSRAIWDTVRVHLQPTKCVCVLILKQKQVILTSEVLKKRVLNFRNPKIWLQSQEKQNEKDACIQDVTVREMLEHGIGWLHPGVCEADCDIVQDLAALER